MVGNIDLKRWGLRWRKANMLKYILAAAAALPLLCTVGWANVQKAATQSQTGPSFNAAMDEAGSWVQTKGRPAHVQGSQKSVVLERSAELGGL
jgi:hypothetical protein